ncbi:Eco57I restriction-modification methylase domain-containing protein [Enterococcus sp.]|uniref:Eco57I restriction-modification methylase domain-containing protein n=1 Tax=Enterococcus sp. TaxID=35783 RepID=UPI003993C463
MLAEEFQLENIAWNINVTDYLKSNTKTYDYIIGNPPYITYHNLSIETRTQLKKRL